MELTPFEAAVLDKLFAGDDRHLAVLREQVRVARVTSREYTGVGFFLDLEVPAGAPPCELGGLRFGDVNVDIEGMADGGGFVVFVDDDGRLCLLEGYCYGDGPWPPNETVRTFTLRYMSEPRDIDKALRG